MANTKRRALARHINALSVTTALAGLMLMPHAAFAQAAAQTAQDAALDEIVVTGSRIIREGYEAPTPVSVLGADELNAMGQPNIFDAVARLPALSGNTIGARTTSTIGGGTAGINLANLRALGQSRTLTLLDGKRVVGSNLGGLGGGLIGGAVDLNTMPNNLIARVDVVTGGASAVYGSDALAGVLNFVLDKEYTGIKGSAQGGITTYGDGESYKVDLTAGTPFAAGRGHFLISGEHAYNAPISHAYYRQNVRDNTYNWVTNPAYGTGAGQSTSVPQYLALDQVGLATAAPGGIITAGPLKGTYFLDGGTPAQFNYGSIISSQYMSGGDWKFSRLNGQLPLNTMMARETFFSRLSYDISDNVTAFAEWQWSHTETLNDEGVPYFRLGNVVIRSDNAFIPESVRARMTALALTNYTMGTWGGDFTDMGAWNRRTFRRYMAGFEGSFDAAGTDWSWDVSASRSSTHISARSPNNPVVPRWLESVDAVRDPATGRTVCRVALGNPNHPCVPINLMGTNVNSGVPGAYPYSFQTGYLFTRMSLNTFAGTVTGEPFELWAGPVSVALNAEHRKEAATGFSSEQDLLRNFFAGNYQPTIGQYSVTEGAFETVVPLARDEAWARSLDLNAAVRATDYSASGYVTTWKVGATYNPVDDITFRVTRSRDIRAPNIGDLFSGGTTGTGTVIDRFRNETYAILTNTAGNPGLLPEKADTTGFGVVLQPTFVPGFGASVDYYNIDIKGAVASLGSQRIMDRCFAGDAGLCALIIRGAPAAGQTLGLVTLVNNLSRNLVSQNARGIDFEASYNMPLATIAEDWDGNLQFRGLATKVLRLNSIDLDGVVQRGAGILGDVATGPPLTTGDLKYLVSVGYTNDVFNGTITMRGEGPGVYHNEAIVCQTGCPVSSPNAPTFSMNHVDGRRQFDLSLNYKLMDGMVTTFFVVDNLFNEPLALRYGNVGTGYYANTNADEGRTFRLGVRYAM